MTTKRTLSLLFLCLTVALSANALDNKKLALLNLSRGSMAMSHHENKRALPYLELAVRLDPNNADAQIFLGHCLFDLDEAAKSVKYLKEGLRLRPNCDDTTCFLQLGHCLVFEGKKQEAIEIFNKGLINLPKSTELYCERGCTYAELDKFDKAFADLDKAIKLKPDSTHYFHERGMLHMRQHQYDQAVKDYTSAINIEPSAPIAYSERGGAYKAMGRADLAKKDYDKAAKLGFEDMEEKHK